MHQRIVTVMIIAILFVTGVSVAQEGVLNTEVNVLGGITLLLETTQMTFTLENPETLDNEKVAPDEVQFSDGFMIDIGAQISSSSKAILYVMAGDDSISTGTGKSIHISALTISPHSDDTSGNKMVIDGQNVVPGPMMLNNFTGDPNSPDYGLKIFEQIGPGTGSPVYEFKISNLWTYEPGTYDVDIIFTLITE